VIPIFLAMIAAHPRCVSNPAFKGPMGRCALICRGSKAQSIAHGTGRIRELVLAGSRNRPDVSWRD